ncbi:MAG: molybdenum transport protein [Actinomycetota bacterium]|nr:molybdenum transport protein [Actinomycetota bacterium]
MIYISDAVIERLIHEDVPCLDLTTRTLGIRDDPATLQLTTREQTTVCGTEEAARVCDRLGCRLVASCPSGTTLDAGELLLEVEGGAAALHQAWRVCLNLLEACSGIATRTAALVEAARSVAPHIEVLTTRKHFPGTKELSVKAVVAGGGLPHRLGLSETLLAFEQHRVFCGGVEGLAGQVASWRRTAVEKKTIVEVTSLEDARTLALAGVDGLQFDKIPAGTLGEWVRVLRRDRPGIVLLTAGGITARNAADHAATGVDALVTSSVYHGAPSDLSARMIPL